MLLLHSSHSTNPNVTPTRLNADAPNVSSTMVMNSLSK